MTFEEFKEKAEQALYEGGDDGRIVEGYIRLLSSVYVPRSDYSMDIYSKKEKQNDII